ncbi:hypothetical protein BGZ73_000029 [Actinomortierella ambigua]|nr:hypothetical protein BGZ73_000029 [Actinomortierella ambigua]
MIKQHHSSAFQLRNPYRLDRPLFSAADLYDNQDLREFLDLDLLQSHSFSGIRQDLPQLQQLQQSSPQHHGYGRPLPPQPENSDKRRELKSTNSQDSQRLVSKSPVDGYQQKKQQQSDQSLTNDSAMRDHKDPAGLQQHQQQEEQPQQPQQRSRNRVTGAMKRLRRTSSTLKKDQSRLKGSGLVGPRPLVDPLATTLDNLGGNGEDSPTTPSPPPVPSITITHHIDSHDELTFERHVEWLTQTALWWDMPVVHLYPAPTGKASIDYVETAASRFSSWVNFVKIDASDEEGGLVGSSRQGQPQQQQWLHDQQKVTHKIDPIVGYVFVGSQDEQTQYQQVFDTMEALFPMIEIRYINSFDSSQPQRYMDSCLQSLGWIHYWSAAKESQVLQSKIINEIVRVRPMWVDPNNLHRNFVPSPACGAGDDEQAIDYVEDALFVHDQDLDSVPNNPVVLDRNHMVSSVSISSMVSDMCLDDDLSSALHISTRTQNHSDSDLLFAQSLCQFTDLNSDDEMECATDAFFDQPPFHNRLSRRHSVFLSRTQSFGEFELPPLSLDDHDLDDTFALHFPDQPVMEGNDLTDEQHNERDNDYLAVADDVDEVSLLPKGPRSRLLKRPVLRREQSRFRFLGRDRRAVSLPDLTEVEPKVIPVHPHAQQLPSEEQLVLLANKAQAMTSASTDPVVTSMLASSSDLKDDDTSSATLADGLAAAATASTSQTNASLGNKLVGFVQRLAVYRIRGSMMVFDM